MKNKLIAALLMFTTPAYAKATPSVAPLSHPSFVKTSEDTVKLATNRLNNSELLTRLQSIKVELQNCLQEIDEEFKALKEEYGATQYKEIRNIWEQLYDVVPVSAQQWSKKVDFFFNTVCTQSTIVDENNENEMRWYTEILLYMGDKNMLTSDRLYGTLQRDQKCLIFSILKKYNNDNVCYVETLLDNFFNADEEYFDIGLMLDATKFINKLLPKIDAKIAKLSTQI